MKTTTDV